YKTRQKVFPIKWGSNESDHLSCHFINYNKSGIGDSAFSGHNCGRRNAQQGNGCGNDYFDWNQPRLRNKVGRSPPAQNSDCRSIRARTGTEVTNTKEGGNQPGATRQLTGGHQFLSVPSLGEFSGFALSSLSGSVTGVEIT